MTLPKADKERLILVASTKRSPVVLRVYMKPWFTNRQSIRCLTHPWLQFWIVAHSLQDQPCSISPPSQGAAQHETAHRARQNSTAPRTRMCASPSSNTFELSMVTAKMECEREELIFILVAPLLRFLFPAWPRVEPMAAAHAKATKQWGSPS